MKLSSYVESLCHDIFCNTCMQEGYETVEGVAGVSDKIMWPVTSARYMVAGKHLLLSRVS